MPRHMTERKKMGFALRSGFALNDGPKAERGAEPHLRHNVDGEAQPRLTSGGKAVARPNGKAVASRMAAKPCRNQVNGVRQAVGDGRPAATKRISRTAADLTHSCRSHAQLRIELRISGPPVRSSRGSGRSRRPRHGSSGRVSAWSWLCESRPS